MYKYYVSNMWTLQGTGGQTRQIGPSAPPPPRPHGPMAPCSLP